MCGLRSQVFLPGTASSRAGPHGGQAVDQQWDGALSSLRIPRRSTHSPSPTGLPCPPFPPRTPHAMVVVQKKRVTRVPMHPTQHVCGPKPITALSKVVWEQVCGPGMAGMLRGGTPNDHQSPGSTYRSVWGSPGPLTSIDGSIGGSRTLPTLW